MGENWQPTIRIHCPCAEPLIDDDEDSEGPEPTTASTKFELPPSLESPYALHTLNSLYFCDNCMVLRCERCVVDEVVQTYCPSCLFVYSADPASEAGRPSRKGQAEGGQYCTRNCLRCPLCFTMTVSLSKEGDASVYLQCPHCSWDSQKNNQGATFSKRGSLYHQLQKIRATDPVQSDIGRFNTLAAFYLDMYEAAETERKERQKLKAPVSPLTPKRTGRSLETTRFLKSYHAQNQIKSAAGDLSEPAITPSTVLRVLGRAGGVSSQKARQEAEKERERCVVKIDETADQDQADLARGISSLSDIQTRENYAKKPAMKDDLLPLPTRLRTRRAKRCRACRHILVRPDVSSRNLTTSTKNQSIAATVATGFRINLLSKNYIPSLRLTHIPFHSSSTSIYVSGFTPLVTQVFALTLFNPLYEPIKVTLATPPRTPKHQHAVTFMTPSFEVGANIEDDWEIKGILALSTQFAELKASAMEAKDSSHQSRLPTGILGTGRNWTTVAFEVVPSNVAGAEIEIPLFVSVAYEAEVAKEFNSTKDENKEDEGLFDKEKRELAFWSLLRIGRVAAS